MMTYNSRILSYYTIYRVSSASLVTKTSLITRHYHRSEWLSRLNEVGALLAIGSEEKPLLLTENAKLTLITC